MPAKWGAATSSETVAQMGKDGWLTLSWPKEFGGQGRPPLRGHQVGKVFAQLPGQSHLLRAVRQAHPSS